MPAAYFPLNDTSKDVRGIEPSVMLVLVCAERSHLRTLPSSEAEYRYLPSYEKMSDLSLPECPFISKPVVFPLSETILIAALPLPKASHEASGLTARTSIISVPE